MLMFKTRLQVSNKRGTFIRHVHKYNDNLSLIKPDVEHERAGRKVQEAENKHEETRIWKAMKSELCWKWDS